MKVPKSVLMLCVSMMAAGPMACKSSPKSTTESAGKSGGRVGNASEDQESPEMKKFIAQFVAIQSPDDFAALLTQIDQGYASYPADLRFVAAQLIPLKGLRGVGHLVHDLAKQSKVADSVLVSSLMATAAGINLFSPPPSNGGSGTGAWLAIFDYLMLPYQGINKRFDSVTELQGFLFSQLVGNQALDTAISRLESLAITSANPIVWDNRIVYGAAGFSDSQDRFVTITDVEKNVALSGLHSIYHNTLVFLSFNNDDIVAASEKLGNKMGINIVFSRTPQGLSAMDRVEVVKKYPNLFARLPNATQYMPVAYNHLKSAVDTIALAWTATKARGNNDVNDFQLLNPARLLPWQRINDASLSNIQAMVAGKPVRSAVTGETVTINIPAFYSNPPANLQAFMPTAFKPGNESIMVAGMESRNFHYGEATQWDPAAYKPYAPDVNSPTDVARVLRVLGQVWGGWFATTPGVAIAFAI
ncbi:MAG: hypothetical protein FJ146_11050 [Deltaproteobacteria bacterium]|nr:hypothetical protein [Deltaproteobacteria bacterium]